MRKSISRPRDINQLAKRIVDIASGGLKIGSLRRNKGKGPRCVSLGRRRGLNRRYLNRHQPQGGERNGCLFRSAAGSTLSAGAAPRASAVGASGSELLT